MSQEKRKATADDTTSIRTSAITMMIRICMTILSALTRKKGADIAGQSEPSATQREAESAEAAQISHT
jgi:hypothetical protein